MELKGNLKNDRKFEKIRKYQKKRNGKFMVLVQKMGKKKKFKILI